MHIEGTTQQHDIIHPICIIYTMHACAYIMPICIMHRMILYHPHINHARMICIIAYIAADIDACGLRS